MVTVKIWNALRRELLIISDFGSNPIDL